RRRVLPASPPGPAGTGPAGGRRRRHLTGGRGGAGLSGPRPRPATGGRVVGAGAAGTSTPGEPVALGGTGQRSGIPGRPYDVGPTVTCAICGTRAVRGARFCHHCGAVLAEASTSPTTERRVVTVLFGDLSDFTAWSEDLDPERVGAVTDRVLAALAGTVRTSGGHVDKLTGDGIMAVFGAPVAHEADGERAVRAARSMQRTIRRMLADEQGGGGPLGLRVGLNTGVVVAGVQASL